MQNLSKNNVLMKLKMKLNTSEKSIQEAIIELYLNVKIRKQDDVKRLIIKEFVTKKIRNR